MQTQATVQIGNPVMQFMRTAFTRIARTSPWKRRRELRVCETISLGNRNFVAVVGYQEQRFLIAGTPGSISLLADVTGESDRDSELAIGDAEEGDAAGK